MVITKRNLSITLNFRDGTTLTLTGDAAQNVLQQYTRHQQGSINNALKYVNADGKTVFIAYKCLCGLVNHGMTETTEEKEDCTSIDCIDCNNCNDSGTGWRIIFELKENGDLYVTYINATDIVTFTLDKNGDLYADYDTSKWSFTLDESKNLYYEEVA